MIVKPDVYDDLIAFHNEQAYAAPNDSGTRVAHRNIHNELLHLKRTYLQLTEPQAMLLMQNKVTQKLHYLHSCSVSEMEERQVYIQYLARHSKVPRCTPETVYMASKQYICGESYSEVFQGFVLGLFFRAITTYDFKLRQDVTIPFVRDYLLSCIDYFECVGNAFSVPQRQVAVNTCINLLELLR